jgi:hypothetical protein
LTGAAKRNAIAGRGLSRNRGTPEKRAEEESSPPWQRRIGMQRECAGSWKLRAPGPHRMQTSARSIGFRAMMFPITAAAGRQTYTPVYHHRRANHREAEDGYQQNCRETPHRFMLLRFQRILQALGMLMMPRLLNFRETNSATSSACS